MRDREHRADIDGLRAVAILLVVLYHYGFGFPGGFVGVDVFFVISGFLIARIIWADVTAGRFSVWQFWERRLRRLVPALLVVIAATITTAWFVILPEDFREFGRSVVAQVLPIANVYFWMTTDYFGTAGELRPLLHTWALAVEAQFYLLFPFLLILLNRWRIRPLPVLVSFTLVSLLASAYGVWHHPRGAFFLLPSRAWELGVGAVLAIGGWQISADRYPRRFVESASALGLIMILAPAVLYDNQTPFPGLAAVPPCFGSALLLCVDPKDRPFGHRLLAFRPVVFVGLVSYSLYLWHWPLLALARHWCLERLMLDFRLVMLVFSFALAAFSWRFVEQPFRRRVARPLVFAAAGMCAAMFAALGLWFYTSGGIPGRFSEAAIVYANGAKDRDPRFAKVTLENVRQHNLIEIGATASQDAKVHVLVWGDSHVGSMLPAIDQALRERDLRGFGVYYPSTAPVLDYRCSGGDEVFAHPKAAAYNESVLDFIRTRHIPNVILVAKWNSYYRRDGFPFEQKLIRTITTIANAGTRVWILAQVPSHPANVPKQLVRALRSGRAPASIGKSRDDHFATLQYGLFRRAECAPFTLIDGASAFFDQKKRIFQIERNGRALYCDDNHLTVAGCMLLRNQFDAMFGDKTAGTQLAPVARDEDSSNASTRSSDCVDSQASSKTPVRN